MIFNKNQLGIFYIILGMTIYSFHDLSVKLISQDTSILQIFLTRGSVGVIVTFLILKYLNYKGQLYPYFPKLALLRCVLMHFGFFIFFICLEKMPLAIVTALFFVSPFFISILSKIFLKEVIGGFRLIVIFVGFLGVVLIVKPNSEQGFELFFLAPLFTAFSYASAMVISNYTSYKENAFVQALQQYFVSFILTLITLLVIRSGIIDYNQLDGWEFVTREIQLENFNVFIIIVVLAVFGCLGIVSLIHAYQVGSPISNGPVEYILLVLAVINGFLFLGEVPDKLSTLGMVFIMFGGCSLFLRETFGKKVKL